MSSSSSTTGTSLTPGSDAFLDSLLSMVNQEDMIAILKAQSQMLDRFEKTNEMLSNFNRLSSKRYEKTFEQFKEHTETLLTMKKDLDSVFRRIRNLKKKLATDYPRAFVAALEDIVPPDLDEEEDELRSGFSQSPSHQQPHQPPQHPPASPRQQELHQQQQQHQQQKQHPQQLSQPQQQKHQQPQKQQELPQPQQNHPPHLQQQKQQQPQRQQQLPQPQENHPPPPQQQKQQAPQKQMSRPQQNHPPHPSQQQKHRQQSQKQQSMDKLGAPRTKEEASNSRHGSGSDK